MEHICESVLCLLNEHIIEELSSLIFEYSDTEDMKIQIGMYAYTYGYIDILDSYLIVDDNLEYGLCPNGDEIYYEIFKSINGKEPYKIINSSNKKCDVCNCVAIKRIVNEINNSCLELCLSCWQNPIAISWISVFQISQCKELIKSGIIIEQSILKWFDN